MRNGGLEGCQAGWESLFPAGFHPPGPVMRSLFDKPRREGQSRFRLHAAQVSFFNFAVAKPVLNAIEGLRTNGGKGLGLYCKQLQLAIRVVMVEKVEDLICRDAVPTALPGGQKLRTRQRLL
jgi:hypothetical protein